MRARVSLPSLAFLAACSVVPDRRQPTHVDAEVLAIHVLAPAGGAVRLPSSSAALTIQELEVQTAGAVERWRDGGRWLEAPAGTPELRVRCRYRAWAGVTADGVVMPPVSARELFPDATRFEERAR